MELVTATVGEAAGTMRVKRVVVQLGTRLRPPCFRSALPIAGRLGNDVSCETVQMLFLPILNL